MQLSLLSRCRGRQNYAPKNTLDYREDRCKREMSLLVVSMSGTVKNVDSLIWTSGKISHLLNFRLVFHYFQVKAAMQCHSFVWLRACCQVNAGKTLSTLHINRFLFISFLELSGSFFRDVQLIWPGTCFFVSIVLATIGMYNSCNLVTPQYGKRPHRQRDKPLFCSHHRFQSNSGQAFFSCLYYSLS